MNKLVKQALQELGVDVPVMRSLVHGKKVTLWLYGGKVLHWELKTPQPETRSTFVQKTPVPVAKPR